MRQLFILAMLGLAFSNASAEPDSTYSWYLRGNVHRGVLVPMYGFYEYLVGDYINSVELSAVRQTQGNTFWDQLYKYPCWGLSLFYSSMGNRDVFGEQISVFPYFVARIAGFGPLSLDGELGLGLTYATKKFDLVRNPGNIAVGAHLNLHFRGEIMARYRFSPRNLLNLGVVVHHFSNANQGSPNLGLNFAAVNMGLWHALGEKREVQQHEIPRQAPKLYFEVFAGAGRKQTRTFENAKFTAAGVSADLKIRVGHKFGTGLGADLFHDASVWPQMLRLKREFRPSYAYSTGLHIAAEFFFNRGSFILQKGMYVGLMQHLVTDRFYNRAMVRYRLTDHFFINASLKTHKLVLDFPDLGFGFKW